MKSGTQMTQKQQIFADFVVIKLMVELFTLILTSTYFRRFLIRVDPPDPRHPRSIFQGSASQDIVTR